MEMKSKNKEKRIAIIGIILLISIVIVLTNIIRSSKYLNNIEDPAILRAMTYTEYTDHDGHEDVYAVDEQTGEETETVVENIEFSAFFLQDLDSDGLAESIAGTCNEIGTSSTIYMELNVLTEGELENGVITINSNNIYMQTALPADDEIKTNAISSNTKTIYLNTINNGTQKLFTGNVRSGDYSVTGGSLYALGNNINNYSAVNSITLTGTYVSDDGERTQISKTVEFTVDWYSEPTANMPTYIAEEENLNQEEIIEDCVDEEAGTFTVEVKVGMQETDYDTLLEGAYIYGEIPELNGYSATNVEITGTDVTYTWNEETGEYEAQRKAVTDEEGNITSEANYGTYKSDRYNYFDFTITYPIDAYYELTSETIVYQLTVNGYYLGYNNENEEFNNPQTSNIATATYVTTIKQGGGDIVEYEVAVGTYRNVDPKRWVISKANPISIYNGISELQDIEDTYVVSWYAYTGRDGATVESLIMKETSSDSETKEADYFTLSTGSRISMEEITTNTGIAFENADNMLGEDGWIKVYDDEKDELIAEFDSSNWGNYTKLSPYYYDESVKHIRVETSNANAYSVLVTYNIKELDDEYIITNYEEEEFETFSYISSTLVGNAIIEEEDMYVNTDVEQAYYEEPYACATLGISTSAFSTQVTTQNVDLSIKTVADGYNTVEWTNGSFLIAVPKEIITLEVNDVTINNSNVEILSWEQYEEDGIIYIKIDTLNDEEETYTITVNADVTPNPKSLTTEETLTLYAYNENAVAYKVETADVYDINNNLNRTEQVGTSTLNISLVSPSSLLTLETVTNYDENGSETIAPNVAEVDKEQSSADINITITNNYSGTISGVVILGRAPFEGNTYALKGTDLGSTFTATMTGEIELPEGLTGTIYYSTNGEASKDLGDEENNWVTADEVTDWSEIKSYLIDISENTLEKGDSYTFTYNVNLPSGLDYNDVTYSHHAVWFNLDTESGKYATYTEPNKVGIMIAKQYDLELTKYQINTDYLVLGATYKVTDLTNGNSKTATTDSNGVLTISGLYVERTYTLQEIKSSSDYELNNDVITFTCTVDDDYNLVLQDQEGNYLNIEVVQTTEDEDNKLTIAVEDEVKATLQIVKTNEEQEALQNIRFKITGKNYANGKTISTDSEGIATLGGLTIGEIYTIEETKTQDGYYLLQEPIEFKVNSNNDGTYYLEIVSDEESVAKVGAVTYTNGIPTLTINIENEEIPSYSLEITKVKENDEETLLQGARYELYSEDTGDYEYLYTGENGTLTFTGLYNYVDGRYITGKYTLREIIAPEGYSVNEETIEFYVELNEDGSQTLNIANEEDLITLVSYDDSSDTIKITLEDKPLFTLSKVTAEDNTVTLAGAKFIIYETNAAGDIQDYAKDVNGNYVGEQDENGDYIITTDENGEYSVGLKGGFYVAVEVEAPYGYALAEDTYFTIEGYDTYKISTVEEFLEFAEDDSTNGLAVELTADLDFTGVDYTPKAEFNGVFIGNGHKISNLKITGSSVYEFIDKGSYYYEIYRCLGLFDYVNGATISGIELENVNFDLAEFSVEYDTEEKDMYYYLYPSIGGIAGYCNDATITNCYLTGEELNVEFSNHWDGYGVVEIGGIVGCLNDSTLENCYNNENITMSNYAKYSYMSALVGYSYNGIIKNSYNIGDATVQDHGGYDYFGGIVGRAYYTEIDSCYNSGTIYVDGASSSRQKVVGGIGGQLMYGSIDSSYNTGDVSAPYSYETGGLFAFLWNGSSLTNCYNEGDISGYGDVGGLIGYNYSSVNFYGYNIIENSYNKGNVTGTSTYVGGIAGYSNGSIINEVYNEGYVKSSSNDVGGITGYVYGSINLFNSYNLGDIEGNNYVGGLIGDCYGGGYYNQVIYNSYNLGNITGTNYIGGILGYTYGDSHSYGYYTEITNCYSTGELTGTSYIGGILGYKRSSATLILNNDYYLETAATIGVGYGTDTATAMTYEEMKSNDFVTLLNEKQLSIEEDYDYELLEWVSSTIYPVFGTDLYFELDIQITEESAINAITEITIEDELKTYNITTEIGENSSGSRTGGTVTGKYNSDYSWDTYINYVETVTHGEDALTDIVITPSDGYEVVSITLDGEEVEYEIAEDGTVTLPALENITADHHYIVTFDKTENQIVINKKDSSTEESLEGVTFQIDQIEDRDELTEEEKDEIIGDMTDNSSYTQAVVNTDEEITDEVLGELTSAGTYYFEESEDRTLTSNNSGVSYATANSYLKIDLSNYKGTYAVVVNGEVSGNGYGYATIKSNISTAYYYTSTGRFMYINGTTNSADYTSSILEGGSVYYLYLGFYTTNTKESQAIINSINIYSAEEEDCVFVENSDGSYSSNNQSDSTTANSYMEIDLTDYSGMYTLTVNAEISTGNYSYGYATVTQTTDAPSRTSSTGRFIYITGEQEATDYTYELEGGTVYYLHFGYYVYYESYNVDTDNVFTINSVDLEISDSDFSSGTYTTDENGQIIAYLHDGTYTATEISGLDGYDELEEPITFTFRTNNKSVANDSSIAYYDEETGEYIIYNKKVGNILVHHVLVDSSGNIVYDGDGNPIYVVEDETSYGSDGEAYTTSPQMDLTEYTIATNVEVRADLREDNGTGSEDDYYIPSNSYGTYISGETIEITYYYVTKEVPITVYHYIEGTTTAVPTSSDDVETVQTGTGEAGDQYTTTSLTEEELAEKYELVSTPANATGIYEYSEVVVTYYYTTVSRDLSLVKTDENGNNLSGVTFTIKGIDEDTEGYEESFTTSSSGTITTTLEYGTYTVQETGTLEGYELDETIYTIRITKEGISLITYDEEGEEVSELLTLNDDGEYGLEIENTITKGTVIVRHYIYDETQENPYTEIQVPSSSGGTVEDESYTGNVGDIYATKVSEDIAENYEYVSSTDNTSGEYIDGTIEVIYYYIEKTEVIVHHYLYDESLGGYTKYQVVEDEEITGYVGTEYETKSSETAKETYEVISETPENYKGNMTEDVIEVTYYYVLPTSILDNNITKTAQIGESEKLTDEKGEITYNISYEVSIENYSGIATIIIVDTLPYAIDEELSDIDGGTYNVITDDKENTTYTITWTEDVTVEEAYTNIIEKEIKIVYENIDVTISIENIAKGTVSTYYPDTYPVEEYQGEVRDQVEAEDTAEIEQEYIITKTVVKTWNDHEDYKKCRPESVTVSLYADGEIAENYDGEEVESIELSEENEWTYTFENLPKYSELGEEIEYTVEESETEEGDLEYYETEITYGEKYIEIENSYEQEEIELETTIEKTGTEVINSLTDKVTYTINYTATITDYEGDILLTITDNLPYSINEELSELDEGIYNFDDNTNLATITWQETIEDVNTYANGDYEINFSKTIIVVYGEDLQLTKGTITNNVTGMIELYELNQTNTVEDSHDTEIKIPSTVIVKYVDIDTGEEIEEAETIEGYVGDEYETEEKQIEDYTFEEDTENTGGEMAEDIIYVIYYYSKNEEENNKNTNEDNTNTNDTNSVDENNTNTNNTYVNETDTNYTNDINTNNENTNNTNTNTSSSTGKTETEENTASIAKTDSEENTSNTVTTLPDTGRQGSSTIIKIGVLIIIIGFIISKVKIIRIDENSNK